MYDSSMAIPLTAEQTAALSQQLPLELSAPDGEMYYLLSADQFGRIRAIFDEDLDPRSMYPQMSQTFGAAGWDDPEMDVYDELDPRSGGALINANQVRRI
jgi:hypothetical protein